MGVLEVILLCWFGWNLVSLCFEIQYARMLFDTVHYTLHDVLLTTHLPRGQALFHFSPWLLMPSSLYSHNFDNLDALRGTA